MEGRFVPEQGKLEGDVYEVFILYHGSEPLNGSSFKYTFPLDRLSKRIIDPSSAEDYDTSTKIMCELANEGLKYIPGSVLYFGMNLKELFLLAHAVFWENTEDLVDIILNEENIPLILKNKIMVN